MAIGFEVAGLALALLPVIVEVVDWYSGRIRGRDSKLLADSLKNNTHIFTNSIEILLRQVVPGQHVQMLLNDPLGKAWKEEEFQEAVEARLGSEAHDILGRIADIHKTALNLKQKLPTKHDAQDDKNMLARAKHVIKCFVQGPHCKASLERLKISIGVFRQLVDDAMKLAPARGMQPKALKHLKWVRQCASGLHDAIQHRLQCDCDQRHPANIKLEVWSLPAGTDAGERKDDISLKFSFLFAEDAERAQPDHWITAEITPLKSGSNGSPSPTSASLGDLSRREITVKSGSSNMDDPISFSRSYSIPAGVEDDMDQNTIADVIHDLCGVLKNAEKSPSPIRGVGRKRLGSISSLSEEAQNFTYHLHTGPDQQTTVPRRRSVKLPELFNQRDELRPKTRINLALMLAWGVLQISSTSWLSGGWSKDNILLVEDVNYERRPYVSHRFPSAQRRDSFSSMTLDPPESPSHIADWVRDASLFALAVFLLEMCYNQSIEDMANDTEKDAGGKPHPLTPFLTASRKAKGVSEIMGTRYAQAVDACLRPPDVEMDAAGKPKDSSQLSRSIYTNIIWPLKASMKIFEPKENQE